MDEFTLLLTGVALKAVSRRGVKIVTWGNKRVGCGDFTVAAQSHRKSEMKRMVSKACCFCLVVAGCSMPSPVLVPSTALAENISFSIPSEWAIHQVMPGWPSDCNGCSYSEASDYFGEDSLIQIPITAPKRRFCIVGEEIQPGSFNRSIAFKPDVKTESRVLKQKNPFATDEEIVVSLKNKTIEVSYKGRTDEKGPIYYCKSISYFGPNRKVRIFFKGEDSPEFRETVAAVRNSIRIKPAFLNEKIDK